MSPRTRIAAGRDGLLGTLNHLARHGIPQLFCTVMATITIYYGITLWLDRATVQQAPIFQPALAFAYLHLWCIAWVILGAVVAIAGFLWRHAAGWTLVALAVVWGGWGAKMSEVVYQGGLLSSPGVYSGLGLLCLAVAVTCIPEPDRP